LPRLRAGTNFKAWIFRILRNTYLTSRTGLAARMRTVALEDELENVKTDSALHIRRVRSRRQTPELNLMRA
jgi:RNA polymerase sigma-70 factor (ECF subfamily)